MKKPTDPTNDDNEPRLEDHIDEDFDRLQALMKGHSELFKLIVQNLVDQPMLVKVTPISGDHTVIFEVQVDKEDVKRVIGRKGRIADALREILLSVGGKAKKRYILEIVEPKRRMDEIPSFYHHKSEKDGAKQENSVQINLEHTSKDRR